MAATLFRSASSALRQERARGELERLGPAAEACVVGATQDAADELARAAFALRGASFGWHRMTLRRLAGTLAAPTLAARGLSSVTPLTLEATCVRLVRHGARARLGRFASLEDRPGLPRALARTLDELRLAGAREVPDPDLTALLRAYDAELEALGLADAAAVLAVAADVAARGAHPLAGRPLVLWDAPVRCARERELVAALAARAPSFFATIPGGDEATLRSLRAAVPGADEDGAELPTTTALGRAQRALFGAAAGSGGSAGEIAIVSAPGESRECVEIARAILRHAARGVPFDRMAVLLRSPEHYRASLEEALRRAGVPACFAGGTVRPDPSGRALLSLLACAAEGLSARRFAEYLSLGELPREADAGGPPPATPAADRWRPPDEELAATASLLDAEPDAPPPDADADADADEHAVVSGSLRAPRLWERLVVDAAVIGGIDRWRRRLAALATELEADVRELDDPEGAEAEGTRRRQRGLEALRGWALPLLEDLAALPVEATWGEWLDRLGALATRALSRPERVLGVLAELYPMAAVGGVTLADVRLALEPRLADLSEPAPRRRHGRVWVSSIERARGLVFDVVFVPGLAERLFPQKVAEDPLLLDRVRAQAGGLPLNVDRTANERLLLRLAVGAARAGVTLSYPRLDAEQGRPRTPSFYGLEVLRAAEGRLPGWGELAQRAHRAGAARIGWPAPAAPEDAIDDAEHDLALLEPLMIVSEKEAEGRARYLLKANPHLERALRFRGRRWNVRKWNPCDGLVDPTGAAREALDAHALSRRTYSPTALQNYAQCPYRFFLYAVHKLSPREEPAPLEELDPLQRGSLVHEVQFELYRALRDEGALPVRPATEPAAQARLDRVVEEVAARYAEDLAPAIPRVWADGIAQIKSDLRELLRRMAHDPDFTPAHFELSFGLADARGRDAASADEGVALECGITLRGSVDLVERNDGGELRVTDYKTGKQQAKRGLVIQGGKILQPVFYALAVEKLCGARVRVGRLYYCTSTGGFETVDVAIGDEARDAAALVARTLGGALRDGFFPAAPEKDACRYCDYRAVCGPYEEARARVRKTRERLGPLEALRGAP